MPHVILPIIWYWQKLYIGKDRSAALFHLQENTSNSRPKTKHILNCSKIWKEKRKEVKLIQKIATKFMFNVESNLDKMHSMCYDKTSQLTTDNFVSLHLWFYHTATTLTKTQVIMNKLSKFIIQTTLESGLHICWKEDHLKVCLRKVKATIIVLLHISLTRE